MCRSTERASFEKKPSMILSHDPCLGGKVKVNRPTGWLSGKPGRGLVRDMSGVVVEDDFNGGVGRIGGVEGLEKLDKFASSSIDGPTYSGSSTGNFVSSSGSGNG